MTKPYTLYGTDHSYYTGKVRPYLRYKGIPYREKLATLWQFKRFIIPRTGQRFIPVLHTPDDEVVQDTTDIIDFLEGRFPERGIYPASPKQKLVALLFEVYGDEWFPLPAMHYRWSYFNEQRTYIMDSFGVVAGRFVPRLARRQVGRLIWGPFKGALGPLGISDKTGPAIEAWFEQFLNHFETHLAKHDYLLGSRPSIGDFALAGPLYAHIWLDPVPRQLLKDKLNVTSWIQRINAESQPEGEFLPGDKVPVTLMPMLKHLFAEQWPLLLDTSTKLAAWLEANPNKQRISRAIGEHQLHINGATEKRLIFPYAQWMMQRPMDHYRSLKGEDKAAADELLTHCDGYQAMQFNIPRRVSRNYNKLVAA